ncbi:hypothetical protein GQ37_002255 [Janthinobacterium sp. BJB1]|uniref:hypothetical protein n=1 Tax=Janthinobacterium sp. GW458P TaxID=1981504 RepID=UPI000A3218A4|nr:hypothetical protein [Janthinobacterium sp. GW458P]MBE3025465.1 hypothetical protein [Janthinobacterium sp. GW458P]PHV16401.1 hypothetical protein CSQ90_11855 [Janthinobacterium sp. BJB303]PJD00453.1 hypothetical protein GQ37_002255 [Janthinobacterium sp. BJB1]
MSIAISLLIRTPVCLCWLQAALGVAALTAAWPLSGAWRGVSGPGVLVDGYALGWPGAVLSALGGSFLLLALRWRRKPHRLDISPVGQLRLAVYLEHGAAPADAAAAVAPGRAAASPRRLLPGSTLWPSLLVLRLADGDGRRSAVLAQRGRACPAFRQLAVACRAIAAREREE